MTVMTVSPESTPIPTLSLAPLNTNVYTVHTPSGEHVGNLKRVGAIWKLKAIGYDEVGGGVLPGGGPLTEHHNTVLQSPDAADLNAALAACA